MAEKVLYGERIRVLRKHYGLTQSQLLYKMGMNPRDANIISRWERDYNGISKESMRKMCGALGLNEYDIFPEAFVRPDKSMTLNQYQKSAQRTSNLLMPDSKLENGLHGLAGEVGELHDHWKKHKYQGHDFDEEHMKKELGDVLWYVAELACGLNCSLETIARMNIEKLQARYPDGFEADKSMNRKVWDD